MNKISVDKNNLHSYKLKLTALSPIHIGTGEVYEPTNYVIDDNKFYGFDEVLFYKSLSNKDRSLFDAKLNDYMQIIDFYKEHKEQAKQIAYFECQSSNAVQTQYNKKINKDGRKNHNQLEIQTTFKNPNTFRAIIPGSSIKGMLDTALQIYPKKIKENDIRQNLIIADAILVNGGVEIGRADRKHRDPEKNSKGGIYQIIEVVQPNSEFVLSIKSKFSFNEIKEQLKRFHSQRENSRYEETVNSFVARIGKNEGKDYIVDDGRNVLNNDRKPVATHFLYNSNTLQDEQFGWVKIELISDGNYTDYLDEIKKQENDYFEKLNKKQKELKDSLKKAKTEAKEKALAKQRAIEAEEKAKQEALKQEKEALLKMTPFEKIVYELIKNHPNKAETLDIIILTALKNATLEDSFRCEALLKVKEEMIKQNKWVEVSKAKKPEKDKKHKKTQEVMKMIQKCIESGDEK